MIIKLASVVWWLAILQAHFNYNSRSSVETVPEKGHNELHIEGLSGMLQKGYLQIYEIEITLAARAYLEAL